MRKVVIFQSRLYHYKAPLFQLLKDTCAKRGIDLSLVHGRATRREALKKDEGYLPWTHKVENRVWEAGEIDIIWQPFPAALRNAELLIIMQENRILSNYALMLGRFLGGPKVAYWGHGAHLQSKAPAGWRERWKRLILTRVDWWFAYTQVTAQIVERAGYPKERITCLNNAIDNDGFRRDLDSVTEEQLARLRLEIGGSSVGLFCGSLYPEKRLDYTIAAADHIHDQLPDFRLIVIGDGPSAPEIQEATRSRPWMKYLGTRRGLEKAAYFRLANVIFNPGAIGLHVLDAFCAGIPMATTQEALHGPEIAYLKDGYNGIVAEGAAEIYAKKIICLLTDRLEYGRLCAGARESATQYTLQHMVDHFIDGMQKCLNSSPP